MARGYRAVGCPDEADTVGRQARLMVDGFLHLADRLDDRPPPQALDRVAPEALQRAAAACLREWAALPDRPAGASRIAMTLAYCAELAEQLADATANLEAASTPRSAPPGLHSGDDGHVTELQNRAADSPPEVLPEVPAPAAARLRQLLDGLASTAGTTEVMNFRSLLMEWLAVASDAGRLIPPEFIAPLLDHRDIVMMSADLGVVVGERGRWLARGNPRWASRLGLPPPGDPAVALRQGPEGDRARALEAIRAVDPGRGRELLAAVWNDVGWSGFACLLGLRVGLGPEDEPFLESVRASDAPGPRHAAEEVLSLLPGSAFAEQVRARARDTVRIHRSQDSVAVAVSGNPSQIELREIVSWTWPADWPADVLRAVAHTEWADDIFAGIVRGTLRLRRDDDLPPGYRDLTRTLIELVDLTAKFPASLDHAQHLLSRLPQNEAEALVIEQLRGRPKFGLHLGGSVGGAWTRWGLRRSAAHLRALAELPRAEALSRYGTWLGLREFALYADLATLDDARTVLTGLAAEEPAIAGEVGWALDTLRLRRLMRDEIAEQD